MIKCRMCEERIFLPLEARDGLCDSCHLALCQQKTKDCSRCKQLLKRLLKFLEKEEKNEKEKGQDFHS